MKIAVGWALVLLLLLPGAVSAQEDPSLTLANARKKEGAGKRQEALELYRHVLEQPGLAPDLRGETMLGAARCYSSIGQYAEADRLWDDILADSTLMSSVHAEARRAQGEQRARLADENATRQREAEARRSEQEVRERVVSLLQEAEAAFRDGRFDVARKLTLDVVALDSQNVAAGELLQRIASAAPDRGDLLRTLIRFVHTTSREQYQRLRSEVARLEREGQEQFRAEKYDWADARFRSGVERIDQSEFLRELTDVRHHLILWLERTIEMAREKGIELPPPPTYPDPAAAPAGFRRRFFDLLSEVFTARAGEEDPLLIYEVPTPQVPGGIKRGLMPSAFEDGIHALQTEGTLTRAQWTERWVRDRVGAGWAEFGGERGAGPERLLDRFEDLLIVQHEQQIHSQIRELLDEFDSSSRPVVVDVALFSCTTAGGTRISARLSAIPGPNEEGYDLLVSGRLLEECVEVLRPLEEVRFLGQVRVDLRGTPNTHLSLTQRTEEHPSVRNVGQPPLVLTAEESLYGLDLQLYAEEMPHANGQARSALSVRARTTTPAGSVVVPEGGRGDAWARLAKPMRTQELESDRIVPHVGTLLLLGLSNPFVGPEGAFGDLALLVAVRPGAVDGGAVPVPDPPLPTPPISDAGEEREYTLGPLASEVSDAVVIDGWPRRAASVPVLPATAERARSEYLAERLGVSWGRLVSPGEPSPVHVHGETATARVPPRLHQSLQAAVQRLRTAEGSLYRVDVITVETEEAEKGGWLQATEARHLMPGSYVIPDPERALQLDRLMRQHEGLPSLYSMQTSLLARATQRVAAKHLHTETILQDVRDVGTPGEQPRFIPVYGTAEEGIIVLVRPELDDDEGRRLVIVDARAAHIQSIETLGGADGRPEIQVPRHAPPQQRLAPATLADGQAIFLTLPAPERTGRVICVKVSVTKVR